MPIIYIQERVIFDRDHYPADTEFSDINAYFERTFLPRNEVVGKRGSELFADSFSEFLRLVNVVLTENRTVTFPFYYKPRDIFFEVVLSRSYLTDHIDIFCLDGTALHKAQQKLDSINHKLSLALDVANIVPWKCDLNNGTILCDINKPVKTASGEMIVQSDTSLSVGVECYFSKIHKEDRDRIRQAAPTRFAKSTGWYPTRAVTGTWNGSRRWRPWRRSTRRGGPRHSSERHRSSPNANAWSRNSSRPATAPRSRTA